MARPLRSQRPETVEGAVDWRRGALPEVAEGAEDGRDFLDGFGLLMFCCARTELQIYANWADRG